MFCFRENNASHLWHLSPWVSHVKFPIQCMTLYTWYTITSNSVFWMNSVSNFIWLQLLWLLWTSALMSSLWCHFYPGEQSSPYESPIWVCPWKSSIQTYRQAWMAHKPQVCSLSLISLWFHWYWYWLYWYWLCWYWHWLYWAHCCFTSPKKNFIHIKGCLPLDWTDAQSLGRTHL